MPHPVSQQGVSAARPDTVIQYQPVIDGLRCVAVLAVLFYHVGFESFSGGFVGVDVFFVISGYLITLWITNQAEKGRFSLGYFYLRRIRRLFPALFVTLAFSFGVAYLLFAPQHFGRFSGALLASLVSVSNIYFFLEVSYFDAIEHLKPLLHTWSLSVEEQFYLVWPSLLLLFRRGPSWVAPVSIGVASFISLFAAEYALQTRPSAAFYLAHYRLWEFALGAILVWLVPHRPTNRRWLDVMMSVGLALILFAVFQFDRETDFPGLNALLPCLGAALCIYSCNSPLGARMLGNRPAVWVGLISYSLYLVHWPIIVLYDYATLGPLSVMEQWGIVIASLLAASLMYQTVEKRFHLRGAAALTGGARSTIMMPVICIVCLGLVAGMAWQQKGWLWRFAEPARSQFDFDIRDFNRYVWSNHKRLQKPFSKEEKRRVLVIGDSQAGDFVNLLIAADIEKYAELRTLGIRTACQILLTEGEQPDFSPFIAERCLRRHANVRQSKVIREADIIFLVSQWTAWSLERLPETLEFLSQSGVGKVILVGEKGQQLTGIQFLALQSVRADSGDMRVAPSPETLSRNRVLEETAGSEAFLDVLELFCNEQGCRLTTPTQELLMHDENHFTPGGVAHLGRIMLKQRTLQELLEK